MSEYLEFAIHVAQLAAALLRERYESDLAVSSKSTAVDLVTDVDQASEALILRHIRERYPDDRIYAEETAQDLRLLAGGGAVWLVDPLDGTVNYAHGFPVFSTAMALMVDGQVVVGVVVDPLRGETYTAERGAGAWLGGRRLRVSARDRLADSLLATGFPYTRAINPDNNLDAFNYLMPRTRGVRRAGSACLDMAWVAAGRVDGYWEMGLQPYDWAAGGLMVEEAGGKVTDFSGAPWRVPDGMARLMATNGRIHEELVAAVQTAREGR